jgi:hypothetical protein
VTFVIGGYGTIPTPIPTVLVIKIASSVASVSIRVEKSRRTATKAEMLRSSELDLAESVAGTSSIMFIKGFGIVFRFDIAYAP